MIFSKRLEPLPYSPVFQSSLPSGILISLYAFVLNHTCQTEILTNFCVKWQLLLLLHLKSFIWDHSILVVIFIFFGASGVKCKSWFSIWRKLNYYFIMHRTNKSVKYLGTLFSTDRKFNRIRIRALWYSIWGPKRSILILVYKTNVFIRTNVTKLVYSFCLWFLLVVIESIFLYTR